jgi:tetratricopeptide (TPR) repeat protein
LIDQHIIKGKPQDANLLFQAANYYYNTNRDYKLAMKWLLEAENLKPENFNYPNLRQKIASELKDYNNAIAAAKRAITLADKEKMKNTIETLNKRITDWEIILKN